MIRTIRTGKGMVSFTLFRKKVDLAVCGLYTFVHAAPIQSSNPWMKPCAGRTPSSVKLIRTIINVNTPEVVQRLSRKTKLFLSQIDEIFSHAKNSLIMDKDMLALLDRNPKTANFPEDCVPTPAQDSDVNKENYIKISKVYILMEVYKNLNVEIDNKLKDLSNRVIASLNDILCEFSFLVNISGYRPIDTLDRNTIINQQHETFTASQFYNWNYILLRDLKRFSRSVLNSVQNGKFDS
ncbi:Hypothetical predicted protein [Mytilus galloprovincialis]|uniref:Uncharacterized protein n=1 Tax=Mytilus galloprovincialis TaxID=29158 RepID=A0A8B6GE56_MYTGA|nr:Hypothetical predicted protein [Mytilus galloprovincialis]